MAEKRILVVQLRQLGDILLTTPCARAIKKQWPQARLTFLSHGMGRLVLDDNPFIDEHFYYGNDWSKWQELQLARTLRSRQFDYVFDFMNNPRSALYTWATGCRQRLGFRSARRLAYTHTIESPQDMYIVAEKFELLKAAGLEPRDEKLTLPWFERDLGPVVQLHGTDTVYRDAPLRVVLSPTHRREPRRWPLPAYAAFADWLVAEHKAYVSWIYGPGEEGVIGEVMGLCQEKTFRAPKTSFREMAAYVANADLFVGNSNGPSHVAVAVDTPSLQIHGPTKARSWCPQTERHRSLQAANSVVDSVEVEDVKAAFSDMLEVVRSQANQRQLVGIKRHWQM